MESASKSPGFKTTVVWTLLLVVFLIMELSPLSVSHVAMAQNSGTNVSGTITKDTTWTLVNSPYNFQGDVSVTKGVTLTIEPGVTVDFTKDIPEMLSGYPVPVDTYYTYSLDVYGVLKASGTASSPINFEDTTVNVRIGAGFNNTINFYNDSSNSIIQNVGFGNFEINVIGCSPSFYGDYSPNINVNNGSPTIERSTYASVGVNGGSPLIHNNILYGVAVASGSPTISNNTFGNPNPGSSYYGGISVSGANTALIYDNDMSVGFRQAAISISSGTPVVERNFIANSPIGIELYGQASPILEDNTIAENSIGLNIYDNGGSPSPTITGDNFEQNRQYNIYLGQQGNYTSSAPNVNAANNWWGTTDLSIINQTIYDHKDDFNLGTVTFPPILTAPNPQAMPNPNAPVPTPNPTQTTSQPTSTSSQNNNKTSILGQTGLLIVIAVLAAVIVGLTAAVVVFWRRTKLPRAKTGS